MAEANAVAIFIAIVVAIAMAVVTVTAFVVIADFHVSHATCRESRVRCHSSSSSPLSGHIASILEGGMIRLETVIELKFLNSSCFRALAQTLKLSKDEALEGTKGLPRNGGYK